MATQIFTSYDSAEFKSLIAECIAETVQEQLKTLLFPTEKSEILTRQEAARALSISLPTLHDYTKRGLIKAHRLGSKVRYKIEDVEAALKQIRTITK